jgi:hypothetical protein
MVDITRSSLTMLEKIRDIINSDNVTRIAKALSEPVDHNIGFVNDVAGHITAIYKKLDFQASEMQAFRRDFDCVLAAFKHLEARLLQLEVSRNINVVANATFDDFWRELELTINKRCKQWTKLRIATVISDAFRKNDITTLPDVRRVLVTDSIARIGAMSKALIKEALTNIGAYNE